MCVCETRQRVCVCVDVCVCERGRDTTEANTSGYVQVTKSLVVCTSKRFKVTHTRKSSITQFVATKHIATQCAV